MRAFAVRSDEPELMDGDSVAAADRLEAMRQLPWVNRFLGGTRVVLRAMADVYAAGLPHQRWRLLDVGSGSADIPEAVLRRAGRANLEITAVALDRDEVSMALARERAAAWENRLTVLRADALRLPFGNQSFDVVTASMFCHHFFGEQLVTLLAEMTRVARRAVIINDLRRHWAAYWGYRVASRLFLRGHLVRYDGEVSVRRGFLPEELLELAGRFAEFRWTLRRRFAYRLCLVGRREQP